MIVFYDPNCPFCIELSKAMSGGMSRDFSGIPNLEPRLRKHESYLSTSQTHDYKKVPMLITSTGKLLGGYDANVSIIRRLGVSKFIETHDV